VTRWIVKLQNQKLPLLNASIPANRPDLIGIVPIFEFLKKWGYSDFQEDKKAFSFVNIWNWVVKDWS